MAYGQTGTGKTYTLGRLGRYDASERGIMVRALEDVIASMSLTSDSVEVSYLQVRNCCLCCIKTNLFIQSESYLYGVFLLFKCSVNFASHSFFSWCLSQMQSCSSLSSFIVVFTFLNTNFVSRKNENLRM